MNFDTILKHVGGNGRYQILVFIIMSVTKMFPSMMSQLPVFIAYKQSYQCRWQENETSVTVPGNGTLIRDQCFVYRNDTPHLKIQCSEWDFDTSLFTSTIRSRYNLVCGWDFLAELSTTIFFLGFVFGSATYGAASDRFGRLVGILASGTHLSICGLAAAFAPNYTSFAIFRFLAGIGNGGILACSFTMMAEVTDKDHRVLYCEMVHNGFSYGTCILALIGYLIRDCQISQIVVAVPILAVWLYPLIISESPRWLLSTKKMARAEKAVKYLARINRKTLPHNIESAVFQEEGALDTPIIERSETDESEGDVKTKAKQNNQSSIMELLRQRPLRFATCINWFSWFAISVGYFATVFTLGDIGGSIFLNLFYSSVIEPPARVLAILIAKHWGRVPTISMCLLLGGLGCLLNAVFIVIPSLKLGLLIMSVINKFWLTAAFDTIWAYSGELYPTIMRNVGVGLGSMWARIGGMLAPQVSLLFDIWRPLPLILMGALPIISGLSVIFLPETLNKDMLEDVKDMLRLVLTSTRFRRTKRGQEMMAKEEEERRQEKEGSC